MENSDDRYNPDLYPYLKERVEAIASKYGIPNKKAIALCVDTFYNEEIEKIPMKKFVFEELKYKGYLDRFIHKSGVYKPRQDGDDLSNYDRFMYWFKKIEPEYQELLLERTLEEHIDRWHRVLFQGSLTGRNMKWYENFLEERGVRNKINDYTLTKAEKEKAFVRKLTWDKAMRDYNRVKQKVKEERKLRVEKKKNEKKRLIEEELWVLEHPEIQKTYNVIKGNGGIHLNKLSNVLTLDVPTLEKHIDTLIKKSMIYPTEPNVYRSY